MSSDRKPAPSENKSISISGDVKDSAVFIGDNNTVNQTFFQKVINIFKSDSETLEHRNRRILLGHVENAWIKGVLDASLHGAALLDLGIKQDPEAVTKYPWAIQKEATHETLPAGTSMLEIFDSIGMGRSLLILGAPGSGKTTMLLELARGLIAHARDDVTQPIPMVFNLASWTEKLTLADWLAQELNNLYSVPRKSAPDWVKGDKLFLLLDGLDEVRQESRAKCVEAINTFRKEHGLTSLAVCSRSQDYADLNAKLSFEGAIEVQPLTQEQIIEFFNRFGDEMAGNKQALEKDRSLREMAETPLFLSIMIMAYRDKQDVEILVSGDEKARRKHLFDTYIERMFERRLENVSLKNEDVLHWLSWVASKMMKYNQVPYLHENMQTTLLDQKQKMNYRLIVGLIIGIAIGTLYGILISPIVGIILGIIFFLAIEALNKPKKIEMIDAITWNGNRGKLGIILGLVLGLIIGILYLSSGPFYAVKLGWSTGALFSLFLGLVMGVRKKTNIETSYPGQKIYSSTICFFLVFCLFWLSSELSFGLYYLFFDTFIGPLWGLIDGLYVGLGIGIGSGLPFGLLFGGFAIIQHYTLRFILARNNLLPWRLVSFLDHCVDLIFLRRVGGGYIFVHRLLMEHFAEIYMKTPTSKGN